MASNQEVAIRISARNDASAALRSAKGDVEGLAKATDKADSAQRRGAASTRNWGAAFSQAQQATRGFQSSLNQTVDRGLLAMGALTVGAVALGLKTASGFQRSQVAFGTLLGSVDQGNTLFKELQSYNLNAAFDLTGIASATQTLLQFGISGEQVLPVLKGLGDVAALSADPTNNLRSMAIALGQISSAGVLRAQDLNQLVQAGFPAYKLLSEISGKTTGQLRKDMESGLTLPADKFVNAIASMQGRTLEVYKGAAKSQNATLAGQWTNFKDVLAQNLATGLTPAIPAITAQLPVLAQSLADAITQMAPQMPKLIGSLVTLAPVAVDLAGGFAKMVTAVTPLVKGVTDLVGPRGVELFLAGMVGLRVLSAAGGAIETVQGLAKAFRLLAGAETAATAAGGVTGAGGAAATGGGLLARLAPFAAPAAVTAGAVAGGAAVIGAAGYESYRMASDNSPRNNPSLYGSRGSLLAAAADPGGLRASTSLNAVDLAGGGVNNYQPTVIVNNPTSNVDVAQATHDGFLRAFAQQRRERG